MTCLCQSGHAFADCCGPLLEAETTASTAEALMRSRYCAYVMNNAPYLLKTWHPSSRPEQIQFESKQQWLGLRVRKHLPDVPGKGESIVEFVARFRVDGTVSRLHEISRFRFEDGQWFYVDGKLVTKGKRR